MLRCSDGLSPRSYSLPKIDRRGIPLQPMVSFVNSPTYNVSRYLARILSPIADNTVNTQNSAYFAELIRSETLDADRFLVSFDVVSLFTKIPLDLPIKVAKERFRYDTSLGQRTSLSVEEIVDLLSFCLNTTYFVFEGTYSFWDTDGFSMFRQ